jgi:hypothetical protein
MKTVNLVSSVLIPALLATTAAWAGEPSSPAALDGQAKAAALLSGARANDASTVTLVVPSQASASVSADGHATAAALLSRPRAYGSVDAGEQKISSSSDRAVDGQTRAAALLSRPRTI